MASRKRGASPHVSEEMAAKIKALLKQGYTQHRIAAEFGINQGRVSEINTGQAYKGTKPDDSQLTLL